MKITHVIAGLGTGGAEAALFRLVTAAPRSGTRHTVVSMIGEGAFGPRLVEHGVPVTCLGMRRGVPDPLAVARLARVLRRERPDVVASWMYHANLLAGAAAALTRVPLVWNIHHADVDPRHARRLTHLTNVLCARLSGLLPARIVCCAESALRSHRALGYRADRMVVIPNGFELDRFVRSAGAGAQVRQELSVAGDVPVVGHIARFHPDKDHATLLAAAWRVASRRPDVIFVLAGAGIDGSNRALAASIDSLGIRNQLRLLGVRRDVPALLSAMDVLALSSRSEAFPQVLGEAMACEVPCAATDCGDSREIVGESGRIVPCGDPAALADAILELLALTPQERANLGAAGRERVRQRYALGATLKRHAALYREVVFGARGGAGMSPVSATSEAVGAASGGERRRVALVISHLGQGGAERVAAALASRWAGAGQEVSVVTVASRAEDVVALSPKVNRVELDLLRQSRSVLEGAALASRRVLALRSALRRLRPDAIVSFLDRTNVLTLLATLGLSVPVFVCERSDPRHSPAGAPWAALRRVLYPRAAGVVVQTEGVAGWARAFCRRVHVIPNFVERPPGAATPGVEEGPKTLLAVGRLSPEKGFDLLVEAFARVAEAHEDWSLTILGEGPERGRLESLVAALGLSGRVSLPGSVGDPRPHLVAAHAFALPSRYEGFPNALLEAMACGLPVAAFECESGPADIVTHGRDGLLVPAGDVGRLALALDRLAASGALRARLGERAKGIAVRFAPESVLNRWATLFNGEGR